jgi:hypothetical protein
MLGTAARGLKVGAAAWGAGLLATMLVGTLVVGGLAGWVLSSFHGALGIYIHAHSPLLWSAAGDIAAVGPLAIALLVLVPVVALLAAGGYLGGKTASTTAAVRDGASVAIGYAAATAAALVLAATAAGGTGADTRSLVQGPFAVRVAIAAIVAPIVLGAAGALLWRRVRPD